MSYYYGTVARETVAGRRQDITQVWVDALPRRTVQEEEEEEEASVQSQRITDVVAPSVSRCGKYFASDLPRERATDRLARIQPALMGIYFVARNTSFPYAVGR